MPRTLECSFCGKEIKQGTGMTFVRRDSSLIHFCSSKCRKSTLNLGRDSRKLKWTKYHGGKEKGV